MALMRRHRRGRSRNGLRLQVAAEEVGDFRAAERLELGLAREAMRLLGVLCISTGTPAVTRASYMTMLAEGGTTLSSVPRRRRPGGKPALT